MSRGWVLPLYVRSSVQKNVCFEGLLNITSHGQIARPVNERQHVQGAEITRTIQAEQNAASASFANPIIRKIERGRFDAFVLQ